MLIQKLETVFLIVLVTISCANATSNGLTVADFYGSDATTEMNVTDTSVDFDLPIQISNFIGIQVPNTVTAITIFGGILQFFSRDHSSSAALRFLFDPNASEGTSVLQYTTDTSLLNRAVQDITSVINIEATPTHLIIFTGTDIRRTGVASGMGATYQVVVATNGEYTYAIIQIVSVAQGVNYFVKIDDQSGTLVKDLPYTDDVGNAPNDSNSGVPGKYIVNLNQPHCPSCIERIQAVACQALRLRNSNNVPRPCQ